MAEQEKFRISAFVNADTYKKVSAIQLEEQLVNRVCMCQGRPTAESAKMMFGTSDVPTVNGIGVGLYSLDGKDVQTFEAPIFKGDIEKSVIPVWECANLSRKYAMDEPDEKKEPTSEVDWEQFL